MNIINSAIRVSVVPTVTRSPESSVSTRPGESATQAVVPSQGAEAGVIFYDDSMGPLGEYKPTAFAVETRNRAFINAEHLAIKTDVGRAMVVIKEQLGKIDGQIARNRPDLADTRWDFALVDDQFKVTGLDPADSNWLEQRLNGNSALLGAARSLRQAAIDDLETTSTNPAHAEFNDFSGHMENYTFYKVGEQLDAKLKFRSLLDSSDQVYDSNKIKLTDSARGIAGTAVIAKLLASSNNAIEASDRSFFAPRYDPLQR